jgi:hypothetical protein
MLMGLAFSSNVMFDYVKESVFAALTILWLGEDFDTEEKVINIL